MDRKSLTKLTRRVALTLITLLQSAHCILFLLDRWTPPRKQHPYLCTVAKIFETGFFALTSYSFVERNRDFRIGRHVIRGLGMIGCCGAWWSGALGLSGTMCRGTQMGCGVCGSCWLWMWL